LLDTSAVIWLNNQPILVEQPTNPAKTNNRERILQAALTVLSRNGYENTSIKDIAEQAGVAQGLIHYYFKSKQELLVAALLICCKEIALDLESAADVTAAFELLKSSLRENGDFHRFFVEMIGVGLHDADIGAGVSQFVKTDRGLVEQVAGRILGAGSGVDARTLSGVAAAVWAANLGITVQRLVDPDFDADAAVDGMALMASAAVTALTGRA
jgi:AcrR family transcriptional regulator